MLTAERIDLRKSFNESVIKSKGPRLYRLRKAPARLCCFKALDMITRLSHKAIGVKIKTFWNEAMLVYVPEPVSSHIFRYGFFEEGLTKIFLEYLKPGMTFFDIGAHFGYFSLLGSFLVGVEGCVHAFEPTPSTFDILKANAGDKAGITLNNRAVSSRTQTVCINDYGIEYSAFNSICDARLPDCVTSKIKSTKHQVEAISVDEYVTFNSVRPNFIKIDAESSEYEILLGMTETLESHRPIVTIEVGDMNIAGVPRCSELINFLVSRGYDPYEYFEGSIRRHLVKTVPYQYDNILFLPKNRP